MSALAPLRLLLPCLLAEAIEHEIPEATVEEVEDEEEELVSDCLTECLCMHGVAKSVTFFNKVL